MPWLLIALLSFSVNADQSALSDVQKINQLYADWRTAVQTADIPGYIAVLHPEVRLIPPGADVINGSGDYEAFLQPVFATAEYKIEVTSPPFVTVQGDIAVAEYEYVIHLTLKDPDQQIAEAGALTASRTAARYFDVLRQNAEGNWTVWRHTWQNK